MGGIVAVSAPAQAATQSCVSTGNGTLCANIVAGDDYRASYQKTSGSVAHVDFNLYCANGTWFGDDGAFYIGAGETRSYVFAIGDHGRCAVKMTDLTTGHVWTTGEIQP